MNYHLRPRSIIYFFITPALKYALRLTTGFIFLFWLGALTLRAADRYVVPPGTPGGTNTGAFTSWSIAATQIQWAVDAAAAGETVWVTNGTYNLTNRITISKAITNCSVNGPTVTIINGNYPAYTNGCFTLQAAVYLTGFTITNGYAATNYGGGIEAPASSAGSVISNCVVAGNYCSYDTGEGCAGGISLKGNPNLVVNCIISNNTANSCGGVFLYNWPDVIIGSLIIGNRATNGTGGGIKYGGGTISNCIIQANISSSVGGGISSGVSHAIPFIYNNTIIQNRSEDDAGGVYQTSNMKDCIISSNSAKLTGGGMSAGGLVQNCIITYNSGGSGGAINMYGNGTIIQNCLIAWNSATNTSGYGGAIYYNSAYSGSIVRDCTIVSNGAVARGGGLYTYNQQFIENSIIYDNTAPASNNYWNVNALTATNSCSIPLLDGTGNITNDPLFVNKDTGNWRLKSNSPCVNRGINQSWMTNAVDLDGRMRIRYGTVDMGAYERIYEGTVYIFH